ncbi:MAG: adenylate/guanylate cyclase domain-containing protein [Chloroflexi bacterium]|nr:adenylate/guanylate cyclase domain-containing protein [Chloroflexota bacterium]
MRERARDELGLLATRFNRMVVDLRQREFMRDLFGRIVSEEVREALLTGDVGLGGESKIVTVLFTDIRDFTTLSEHFTPQEVVNFLNQYFGVITQPIREVGGLVNKFGGDSTLAIFGAPVSAPPAESAWQAVRAALMIRARLAEYNARRVDLGRQLVRMGIGINTGEVITGNVGSEERFEYTVIGDTVNIASRVEGTTKEYVESQIMITEATLNALGKDVRLRLVDHGQVALKGKKTLVRIYGVFGIFPDEAEEEDWLKLDPASRRNVLEALLIYCKGYSVSTAALTKNMTASGVQHWIDLAAEHIDSASATLRREYGLTDAELDRLRPFASRRSQPVSQPVSYIESKVSVAVAGDTPSPAIRG